MAGPLDGVRVVELGMWVAGPACAGVLADWGADVVKIEGPDGDPSRGYQRLFGEEMPTNPIFEQDNRGKRGIGIDLQTPEGLEIALELLDQADVFVTNVRRAALERMGLGYEALHARDPRLIYAMVLGYGLDGPDADRPAYDIGAYWSRAGIASLLSPREGQPPFQRGAFGDHQTGSTAAGSVCAALFARERTGQGQLVTTSLLRQGAYAISFDLAVALGWGRHIHLGSRESMPNPTMNNYIAGDGKRFWVIGQVADRHWPSLARSVGRPEWIADERYATAAARAGHMVELREALDEIFATKTREEWGEIFDADPEFFWAPINTVDDLLVDPQFHAGRGLVSVPDGEGGTLMVSSPCDFSDTWWEPRSMAPALGQHTHEVLGELGRTPAQIAELETCGAVFTKTA